MPCITAMQLRSSVSPAGTQPAFDVAVVGFDPVIAIAARSLPTALCQATLALEFPDRRRIAPQPVSREHVQRSIVGVCQSPLQKQLGGFAVARFGEVEIDGLSTARNRQLALVVTHSFYNRYFIGALPGIVVAGACLLYREFWRSVGHFMDSCDISHCLE
jgi:hypothetical protein